MTHELLDAYREGRNWIHVGDTVKVVIPRKKSCLARVTRIYDTDPIEVEVVMTTTCDRVGRAPRAGSVRTLYARNIQRVAQTRNGHKR